MLRWIGSRALVNNRSTQGRDLGLDSICRNCATDCGRSECRILKQASIAATKARRYPPEAALAIAGGMQSSNARSVDSTGGRPVTAR